MLAAKILPAPYHVPDHDECRTRPQHEVVEVLIDREKMQRRQEQRDEPHPPVGDAWNQQHSG